MNSSTLGQQNGSANTTLNIHKNLFLVNVNQRMSIISLFQVAVSIPRQQNAQSLFVTNLRKHKFNINFPLTIKLLAYVYGSFHLRAYLTTRETTFHCFQVRLSDNTRLLLGDLYLSYAFVCTKTLDRSQTVQSVPGIFFLSAKG